jgi:hypothetical protein
LPNTRTTCAAGLRSGRIGKAKHGKVVGPVSAGYIHHNDGTVELDPDEAVQAVKGPRGPLGAGNTLLQRLLRCGLHREWRHFVHFGNDRRDGTRSHRYRCHGDYFSSGGLCRHIPGERIDALVEAAVIEHLSPANVDWLRPELERAEDRARARRRSDEYLLGQARRRAEELNYRYKRVDPDNRLVALEIEREYQHALEEVQVLVRAASDSAATTIVEFDQGLLDEAADLYTDVRRILRAASTEKREVKELFHIVIDRIVVTERTLEEIRASIRWKDGSPPTGSR